MLRGVYRDRGWNAITSGNFCWLRVLGVTPRVLRLAWGTFVFFGFYEMQLKCLYVEKSD